MQQFIAKILRKQAQRFLRKNRPTVIVISGSVGKTSTTQAIATVLSHSFNVRKTLKNYNSDLGVSCSILGMYLPKQLKNPVSWVLKFVRNEFVIILGQRPKMLVLELGTDAPGDIEAFSWLQPQIAVVTAVAPEHMEFFKDLKAVAKEELSVSGYSDKTFVNRSMVPQEFLQFASPDELFNYDRSDLESYGVNTEMLQVVGEHSLDAVAAACRVAKECGMSEETIQTAVKKIQPQPGRMNKLKAKNGATIIDDTYNASPEATKAALLYLMHTKADKRIALIGNMNELGETSASAHQAIGKICDPKKLQLVVTLGKDANAFAAVEAKKNGCTVVTATTPYEAADIIEKRLTKGSIVLCKGSQNGVFAEETVKRLLADPADAYKLVRQDKFWLKKKRHLFGDVQ